MQQATIKVEGMTCRSCIRSIEDTLSTIGVEGHVDFEQSTVQVQYDKKKLELSDINEAIKSKGYEIVD